MDQVNKIMDQVNRIMYQVKLMDQVNKIMDQIDISADPIEQINAPGFLDNGPVILAIDRVNNAGEQLVTGGSCLRYFRHLVCRLGILFRYHVVDGQMYLRLQNQILIEVF